MSTRHPVIAITGSSGAGTTTVTRTFQHIFRREGLNAAIVEGDSFHRHDRQAMKARMAVLVSSDMSGIPILYARCVDGAAAPRSCVERMPMKAALSRKPLACPLTTFSLSFPTAGPLKRPFSASRAGERTSSR